MIWRVLFIAVGLAAVFATPAAAADPPTSHPLTTVRIAESLRIAEEFWGQPAPCHVRVYEATPAQLKASIGVPDIDASLIGGVTHLTVNGEFPAECPIWLSSLLSEPSIDHRVQACTDLTHELGHVLGYGHDDATRPGSVMNADSPTVYGCYRRFVPRGWGTWWRDLFGSPEWAQRP